MKATVTAVKQGVVYLDGIEFRNEDFNLKTGDLIEFKTKGNLIVKAVVYEPNRSSINLTTHHNSDKTTE